MIKFVSLRDNSLRLIRALVQRGPQPVQACRLCGLPTASGEICTGCKHDLPWRTAPWRRHLPHVDEVCACFDFAYPIRQLIHRTKYGRDIACARFLGELAAPELNGVEPPPRDALLFPVPLARGRMIYRGFNQAMELALVLGGRKNLKIDEVSVYKPYAGRAQSTLDAMSRRVNIRHAFRTTHAIQTDTAIIVDDVLTTGSTASAMAATLKAAGAKKVHVWVIAAV